MSGIGLPDCSGLVVNWKKLNDVTISDMVSSSIFLKLFRFSCHWSKVLELCQFFTIKDWSEIWKSKISPSKFSPISGDWGGVGIPNLARTSLLNCYWTLQNARVTVFTVSELLRENKQKEGSKITSPHTHIRVN